VAGDFNYHVDDPKNRDATEFKKVLKSLGLKQHVKGATQNHNHTLDLFITRLSDGVDIKPCIEQTGPSDHYPIFLRLPLHKPQKIKKEISYRKHRSINKQSFQSDLKSTDFVKNSQQFDSVDSCVASYNKSIEQLLEKHAPIKKRTITLRPESPWFNDSLQSAKRSKRQLEKQAIKSGLQSDRDAAKAQCNLYYSLIDQAKEDFYTSRIDEAGHDQKKLFNIVNSLLNGNDNRPLPLHDNELDLAERFSDFFIAKIDKIRSDIDNKTLDNNINISVPTPQFQGSALTQFKAVTEEDVSKIIRSSVSKSCDLDPWPTWMLKENLDPILPSLTHLINRSLATGTMPSEYKHAIVTPLIKKPSLPPDNLKNYRPVSNLPYLSKIIEKVVAFQLNEHLSTNNIGEKFQSAYRKYHSTETATLRVQNDILRNLDQRKCMLLVLLDLSAAFDTIDHNILA